MNALERVQKDLEELRSEVRLVAREAKADATTLAKAVRRGRVEVTAQAHNEAWQRLAPDVSLVRWKPRAGEGPETPDLSGSLVARLRAGDPVADSLGNLDAVGGLANVLVNPLLEPFGYVDVYDSVPASGFIDYGWKYDHYVTSGGPADFSVFQAYYRGSQDNPFNSALGSVLSYAARAIDATIVVEQATGFSPGFGLTAGLPYLAAAARFGRYSDNNSSTLTKLNAWVEIWDTTAAAAVAWSPVYDLMAWGEPGLYSYETVKAVAMLPEPVDGWFAHGYKMRICVNYAHSGAGTGSDWVIFGDPQLAFSTTNGIPPFMPAVGAMVPSAVKSYLSNDTTPRVQVAGQYIQFGPGSGSMDLLLHRPAASTLRIIGAGGNDEALQIGDDSTLYDVDISNMLGIKGQSDATLGGFVFGSAKDTNLYRKEANVLKTDDRLEIGVVTKATDVPFLIREGTSNDAEFAMFGDGAMWWGAGGTTPRDTNLYRHSANSLATDDMFRVINNSGVVIASTIGNWSVRSFAAIADANPYFQIGGSAYGGLLAWGAGGATAVDTILYRSAANVLSLGSGDVLAVNGTQVLTSRRTGWAVPSGTAQRTTFATDTVSLINLARAVKAIKDDLTAHGLLGA